MQELVFKETLVLHWQGVKYKNLVLSNKFHVIKVIEHKKDL